jgi:lipoyl(octanoyl) transferase
LSRANLVHLGRMGYQEAWDLQRRVGDAVGSGALSDTVLLVEHPPVYTVGRSAHGSLENLLWDEHRRSEEGISLFMVDRGGDITYHGPGQLVGYPILDLNRHGKDLLQYLRRLERALIKVLARFDIAGMQDPPHTGVWVGGEKVAAIGVKASQWISQHGFALNVDPDLAHFTGIIPCGIHDKGVTSMARILGRHVAIDEVMPVVEEELAREFVFEWEPARLEELIFA